MLEQIFYRPEIGDFVVFTSPRQYTLVAPFYKHYSQRSYRLLATLAGYMVVSLTLVTTARCSPLERFGLNVSC